MMKNVQAQRKEDRERAKKEGENLKALYQMTFSTPEAQRVLRHIAETICKMNEDTFNESASISAYQQGRRSVAVHLYKMLNS